MNEGSSRMADTSAISSCPAKEKRKEIQAYDRVREAFEQAGLQLYLSDSDQSNKERLATLEIEFKRKGWFEPFPKKLTKMLNKTSRAYIRKV